MSKVERLLNLTAVLLETRVPLSADELREQVEGYPEAGAAFKRAFERDKEDLRTLGIPITVGPVPFSDPPTEGYRVPPDDYYLPDPGLTPEELAALNLAALAIRLDDLGSNEALWKLGAAAGSREQSEQHALATIPVDANLGPVFGAITANLTVGFSYRGEARTVEPWRLDFQRGRWYLTGHDLDRDAERNFRLDRIEGEVDVSTRLATQPRAALGERKSQQAWEIGESAPTLVKLLVDADRSAWARQQLGDDIESVPHPDGGTVFSVPVVHEAAFVSFVLGFLDHAEVLEPPAFRSAVIEWLEQLV